MSSEALVEGPTGVLAAWETEGRVSYGKVDAATSTVARPIPAPGAGRDRKHPALAVNGQGEVLFAWTEGTGWERGGALAWQLFDSSGRALEEKGRVPGAIPVWGLATAAARPDGGFTILY